MGANEKATEWTWMRKTGAYGTGRLEEPRGNRTNRALTLVQLFAFKSEMETLV